MKIKSRRTHKTFQSFSRPWNSTQLEIIDSTLNSGISNIQEVFQNNIPLQRHLFHLLSTLNENAIMLPLMSENSNSIFRDCLQELLKIIFSKENSIRCKPLRPLFYLCGLQSIDGLVMQPLLRLQEKKTFTQAQQIQLRGIISQALSAALYDATPATAPPIAESLRLRQI